MTSVFGLYSRYYDLLYRDKDYASETAFIVRQLAACGGQGKSLLELGCGTGIHAALLAERDFAVHAVDISAEMLAAAETRRGTLATPIAQRLSFAQGDLRSYRCSLQCDAVISLFHVFSYQTSNEDLQAAFATASEHLKPGGLLAFDFWYGPAVLHQRPEVRVRRLEDERTKVVRIAESTLRPNENRVDVKFTVTVEDKATGARQELEETHAMRYLFLPEIDLLLKAAGFERQTAVEWMTAAPMSESTWGGFVVARKNASAR